jgi:hypothetical protein
VSWAAAASWLVVLYASHGAPIVALALACLAGFLLGKKVGEGDA